MRYGGMAPDTGGAVLRLAIDGDLKELQPTDLDRLIQRKGATGYAPQSAVASIIERVRNEGDAALIEFAAQFDGATLDGLEVSRDACTAALSAIDPALRGALRRSASAIATFHRAQLPESVAVEPSPGVRLRRTAQPLERAGIYAPGGRASYPSSVLMGAIPARVAGVKDVIVCSPPDATGAPPAAVLAACAIAGVDRVFAAGGAGAIAALAFGTESIPAVDRIVGPGNSWVNEAKRQVQSVTGIDCPAGPSEILIIADHTADALLVAAELVAQAEHDPEATAVLVSTDRRLLEAVRLRMDDLLAAHGREQLIRNVLSSRGAFLFSDLDGAMRFASAFAPEHLLLAVAGAETLSETVRNAGTVFIGQASSVVFGDYITGANHVLPTGGLARTFSGLDVLDFMRWTTTQQVEAGAAAALAAAAGVIADAERLPGHAFAARLRAPAARSHDVVDDGATAPGAGHLGRTAYREVYTYDPGRQPVAVDLSDNTCLFGVCPTVRSVLTGLADATVTRYPSVYAEELRNAAASHLGVAREAVVTGCGSDDVIDSAMRAFCEPGDVIAYPWPTFGIVSSFARMNAARPVGVTQYPGAGLDVDGLIRTGARMIYICRPNNPTGDSISRGSVNELAAAFDGVILLDEAYAEFAPDDFVRQAADFSNLVVLRTLSKAWGMAGLRVGLAVGDPKLIAEIEKSRGPYKVSGPAELAATLALREGGAWVRDGVARAVENRKRLTDSLRSRGHTVLTSEANFVLVALPAGVRARTVTDDLFRLGVGVRPFEDLPLLGDCIRVTIGPWDMMQAFLDAFDAVCPGPVR